MYWIYSALTRSGQEITSTLMGPKKDVLRILSEEHLSVIEIRRDYHKIFMNIFPGGKLSALSMAVFFEDFSNMLETGMSVPQILLILKETAGEQGLVSLLSILETKLSDGESLTEALAGLNIFPWIVSVTLSAGEKTGNLGESTKVLGKYFRASYQIQTKVQQALIYPAIVFTVLLAVMFFVSFKVIPQLKNLLPVEALHHQTTQWILWMSSWLQEYGWVLGVFLFLGIVGLCYFQKKYRYQCQQCLYAWPLVGDVLKESTLALYFLNLSVLLKSTVGLLKSLEDLNAIEQSPVSVHFAKSREYILGGMSFWEAIEQDSFFPGIIPSTLRRAEEMVKMDEYCFSLGEHFSRRVNSRMDALLHFVQPALLAVGGVFLVIIALGFLVPIYGSLTAIAGGQ